MYIVWWIFALALFAITRFSPTYAENGIMLDGVIDKIAWTGEATADQWAWGDDVLLWGKEVAEDGNPQTEDFYSWNQKIPSPQGGVSPLSKGEQSWDDGEESPNAPQNDEWDVDNNPGSSSMTDQDWNREQGEDGVEPGLNWKKDAQDSSLGSEWQADEQITQIAK